MSWAQDSFSPAAPFPQYSRVRSSTAIEIITQWSGRASVQQTRDYIHQDPVRKASKYGSHIIPVADVTPEPITAAEYDTRSKGPITTTLRYLHASVDDRPVPEIGWLPELLRAVALQMPQEFPRCCEI
jgi:hypothetical protein